MDNWYVVTPEKDNAKDLLHMFWSFHDFRITEVNYSAEKDSVDVVFEYDDRKLRVLLRFEGNVQMYVAPVDFEADWIIDATLFTIENQLQWIQCSDDETDLIKSEGITYFRGDTIRWAIIDGTGNRLPVPDDMLHQRWEVLNFETMEYEEEYHSFSVTLANGEQ